MACIQVIELEQPGGNWFKFIMANNLQRQN